MKLPTKVKQQSSIEGIKQYLQQIAAMRGIPPKGWKHTPESYILEHGKPCWITPTTYKGKRGTPKLCYMNAAKLAQNDSSLTYVEGYVDISILPIEHAWCVDANFNVIDPTLSITTGIFNPVGYFGVPFSLQYLTKTLVKKGTYGLLHYDNREIYK